MKVKKEIEQKNKDLFQALKEADRAWRNYQDYLTGADKPYVKMIDANNELLGARQFADGAAKRFVKAGKELGVDVSSNSDYKAIITNNMADGSHDVVAGGTVQSVGEDNGCTGYPCN